jgi:RNA recognition motif-containing protein
LKELFARYGTVTDVRVIERKGFGFVENVQPEEAEKAKEAPEPHRISRAAP